MKLFCPSCGAALEFRYDDSFVRVCASCRSAILRTDRGIDTLGRFADLAPARSGLTLSATGRFQGQPFVLAGRAEYAHPAGGSWEEWFLKLGDGRWAWLSHAHGQWALTFRREPARSLPEYSELAPGTSVTLGADPGISLTVGERSLGTLTSAEGELPEAFVPGTVHRFIDASDAKGRAATIDYGPAGQDEAPVVYLGRRTNLRELGLSVEQAESLGVAARTGQRLACPNCGGSIELRVPDRSLCVTCPYCGSLLDCEGPLAILARLGDVEQGHPALALGAAGVFEGVRYIVTGRLRRVAKFPGGFVEWDEYLLYAERTGYRWLVCARGHYSFVTPLDPGAVSVESDERVRCGGTEFKVFDRGSAEVSGVWGEFYWKVSLGESVSTADFIAPPAMLSRESSEHELHWSLGVYQTLEQVRQAFNLPSLPDERRGVAPHQPFKHVHWGLVGVLLAALLLGVVFLLRVTADARQVFAGRFRLGTDPARDEATLSLGPGRDAPSGGPPYILFTPPFELEARQNTQVSLEMPLDNSWAYASVDLVDEATGELRTYGTELAYYSGVEGGEHWAEGSRSSEHLFGAGRAGSHVLRLEVQTPGPSRQVVSVSVAQDVFALGQLGWVLLLLGVPGGFLALSQWIFERSRWSESDFAPSHYGGSDE